MQYAEKPAVSTCVCGAIRGGLGLSLYLCLWCSVQRTKRVRSVCRHKVATDSLRSAKQQELCQRHGCKRCHVLLPPCGWEMWTKNQLCTGSESESRHQRRPATDSRRSKKSKSDWETMLWTAWLDLLGSRARLVSVWGRGLLSFRSCFVWKRRNEENWTRHKFAGAQSGVGGTAMVVVRFV